MIASNIANADTPFYRPRDISFGEMLAQKRRETFAEKSATLTMASTDGKHFAGGAESSPKSATTFFRDGHMARNDGNSVDLDVETTEMAKNSTMFNALTAAVRKEALLFKTVIESSGRLS